MAFLKAISAGGENSTVMNDSESEAMALKPEEDDDH